MEGLVPGVVALRYLPRMGERPKLHRTPRQGSGGGMGAGARKCPAARLSLGHDGAGAAMACARTPVRFQLGTDSDLRTLPPEAEVLGLPGGELALAVLLHLSIVRDLLGDILPLRGEPAVLQGRSTEPFGE